MSLPGPPPLTPRRRGPTLYAFPWRPAVSRHHTIKTGASGTGLDYTLRNLVELWTGVRAAPGAQQPLGPNCRWTTVVYLRVLRLVWSGQAVPAQYQFLVNDPRVSRVGIAIGSKWCDKRQKHIDIDWFGPPPGQGNGQGNQNWWKPPVDGRAFEQAFAEGLLHYLEASLGLDPSDVDPSTWSWPPGLAVADAAASIAALSGPRTAQQVVARAATHGFANIGMEWWIGNQNAPNPIAQPTCGPVMTPAGMVFRVESPDCNPPDPHTGYP